MTTRSPKIPFESGVVQRQAFVVAGMHRSGTSAMTRTLSLLGAALPRRLMPPVEDVNVAGFWEPQGVADLNDEILQAQDSDWDDVFSFRPREYLSNFDRFYAGRAAELLQQEYDGSEVIVLKDPRISVLTRFWDRALADAGYAVHYVIMVRNPLEVAESLRARDSFPREKSLLLWSSYMVAAERDTRTRQRIFVSYDDLLNDWRSVRRRIEKNAGFPFPRDTATAANEIDRHLNRGLRHHDLVDDDLFARSDVAEEVKTLFGIFKRASAGAEVDFNVVDQIQKQLAKLDELVGPLLADMRGSARALAKDAGELSEAHAIAAQRAQSLGEQLATERALRNAEAARASELTDRLTAAEAQLAVEETELIAARDMYLSSQEALASSEQKLAAKETEVTSAKELCLSTKLALEATEEQLARQLQNVATLTGKLKSLEDQIGRINRAADEARVTAEAAAAAKENKLAERFRELAALTEALKKSEQELRAAKREAAEAQNNVEAAAREKEGQLNQRYREIASLTKLLAQKEERAEQADDFANWLMSINEHLRKEARLTRFRSARWRRRQLLRRLQERGLFDGDAYLRFYPDVAEAGYDPLDHFLSHGLREGRLRDPEAQRPDMHATSGKLS